ncbi:MAG: D-alanine--D-alanine ligase [Muribaculaceae bacterium]|nr:D-alanine--D-alanine ligase [Muribaculaceae bacterium]
MKTRIGVIFGGRSTEHEISVISASQAMHAINRDRFDVTPIYITKDGKWYTGDALLDVANYRNIPALLARCKQVYMRPETGNFNLYLAKKPFLGSDIVTTLDVIIPVLHGSNGEDGTLEGLLETIGIPFAGCNTLSSANGMDKITMKMILKDAGIPVVDYVWFTDKQWFRERDALVERIESTIGYPVIVKPANLGSSVGIGRADNREQLLDRVNDAERYSTRIIVEDLVENLQEINCSVLGDCDEYTMSVLEEPIKTGDFLTYEDKYMGGTKGAKGMQASQKRIPAELPADETERIKFLAGETFRVLSCHGVSRVDVIIDRDTRNIYVNEINTIPGSLSFYLWEATGLSFEKLMERLVALAIKRRREMAQKTQTYDRNIFSLGGGGVKGVKGVKGAKR